MKRIRALSKVERIVLICLLLGLVCSTVGLIIIDKQSTQVNLVTLEHYIQVVQTPPVLDSDQILAEQQEHEMTQQQLNNQPTIDQEESINVIETEQSKTQLDSSTSTKVNINTATLEQLQQLKGIGPSKARAIIEEREKGGPFKTIEDIKRVKGIGDKTFQSIKESLVN